MIGKTKTVFQYYSEIFEMKRYAGFSLLEINQMYPYEFEIYYYQTIKAIKDEENGTK